MRSLLPALAFAAALATAPGVHAQQRPTASADAGESRVALVIGNASYKDAPLANPVNDARAIAKALNASGFNVKLLVNLTQVQMRQAIREFGDELQSRGGVGLFYFAGHGVQISNRNFLIPVGADIRREYEVQDQAVDASAVLAMMQTARARMNIVILDACRNNPFIRDFRSTINGLAPMQAPAGTLVAFSTAPGETAIDGTGEHGLYTEHLVEQLAVPGLKIEDVFKNVRTSVRRDSSNKQVPWENTSLEGDFYFKAPTASAGRDSPASQAAPQPAQPQPAQPQPPAAPPAQVALAAPGSRAQPPVNVGGRVERPDIQVGDRWKYLATDRFTNLKSTVVMEVASVADSRIYTRSAQSSLAGLDPTAASGVVDVWDRDWNQLREGEIAYAPFYPSLQFPLEAGKTWSGTVKFDVIGGEITHELTARVVGWERVAVPAGTFDAVKITLRGPISVRTAGASGFGAVDDVLWYAPAVRQFVRKDLERRVFESGGAAAQAQVLDRNRRYERWELVEYRPN